MVHNVTAKLAVTFFFLYYKIVNGTLISIEPTSTDMRKVIKNNQTSKLIHKIFKKYNIKQFIKPGEI